MARHYFLGFFMLFSCSLLEALPRPTNNEETTIFPLELTTAESIVNDKEERSLMYEDGTDSQGNTKEIVDKIKAINDAIKKPHKRPQINWNTQPQTGGSYIMDKDVLEKLQQIIASGKLHSYKNNLNLQDDNLISDIEDLRKSRELAAQLPRNQDLSMMSMAYMTSLPVLIMPSTMPSMLNTKNVNGMQLNQASISNGLNPLQFGQLGYNNGLGPMQLGQFGYSNSLNPLQMGQVGYSNGLNPMQIGQPGYQTRQGLEGASSPFGQISWPFANLFPILIRDPLLTIMNGGGWNNFIEAGQSADVCRRQKSSDNEDIQDNMIENEEILNAINNIQSRQGRAIKKRTVTHQTRLQDVDNTQKTKKIFSTKPLTTRKPVKQAYTEQDTKTVDEGDLRFPFGDFTFFGNKKPVAPSPGFFINRLKVRRGGVAIAGPGGVATAGRGGTAIVGPGGLAYTQPGGIAVAGPAARVVALAPDADLSSIISKLQAQDGSVPRSLQPIIEGRVVATGPVIYYHPNPSYVRRIGGYGGGDRRGSDIFQYDGVRFGKGPLMTEDPMFLLFVKPVAHASSLKGIAIANPISNVIIARNTTGSIVHAPLASAVAGPGGIAHAQSDLNLYEATTQYLPFYGGAKGQYLEIKKDTAGSVTSEKIISEDKISSDNIFKHSEENLLSKVLAANLQSLRTVSNNILKLHNLGRKTGRLGDTEKTRFRTQLAALGEAASNTIKLIEEIGDNVDLLYIKNSTATRKYGGLDEEEDNDDVGEEGVGIDADGDGVGGSSVDYDEDGHKPTIAEAKPIGLAVIGEHGIAASRPIGTAVALSGVAIARPIATAIAGVDPAALGINFQINHHNN